MVHNRIWAALVLVLAFICLMGMLVLGFVTQSADSDKVWAIHMIMAIEGLYVLVIAATLIVRQVVPAAARVVTIALNIILLFTMFPIGTAIGIYGLWKVDRKVARAFPMRS
jgi:hypothetical protein